MQSASNLAPLVVVVPPQARDLPLRRLQNVGRLVHGLHGVEEAQRGVRRPGSCVLIK